MGDSCIVEPSTLTNPSSQGAIRSEPPAAARAGPGYAQLIAEGKALRRTLARERVLLLAVTVIALVAVAAHLPGSW